MADEKPTPLEYARPMGPARPARRSLIPPDQSAAGVGAFLLSLVTTVAGLGFVVFVMLGEGYGAVGTICLATPFSLLTIVFGLLGLTEEGRNGYRDSTLARWSLWLTVLSWLIGAVVTLFVISAR